MEVTHRLAVGVLAVGVHSVTTHTQLWPSRSEGISHTHTHTHTHTRYGGPGQELAQRVQPTAGEASPEHARGGGGQTGGQAWYFALAQPQRPEMAPCGLRAGREGSGASGDGLGRLVSVNLKTCGVKPGEVCTRSLVGFFRRESCWASQQSR